MKNYYNIVLIPPAKASDVLTNFAQKNFSSIADGYCLKKGDVFPHITLAQLQCDDLAAEKIAQAINAFRKDFVDITFSGFQWRMSSGKQGGFLWAESPANMTSALAGLHARVVGLLRRHGLEPLNNCGPDYAPHVTFARIPINAKIPEMTIADLAKFFSSKGWCVEFGHCDKNGQYLGSV